MKQTSKDPFRMPADMNDIDELKAHIRKLEEELELAEKWDGPPWWALNVRNFYDPSLTIVFVSLFGSAVACGLGGWHAWALASHFAPLPPYVMFWVYLLNIGAFVGAWLAYCLISWRRTDVQPLSLPARFSVRKSCGYYFVGDTSAHYAKTLKGAVQLAHSLNREKGFS